MCFGNFMVIEHLTYGIGMKTEAGMFIYTIGIFI